MEAKLRKSSLISVLVIFAVAGFWHFLYDFMPCGFIGAISPVNESPWEHAKLFFIPAIICFVVVYALIGKKFPNFIFSHAVVLLIMPVFMLLLFYAFQSFFDETLAIDIINAFLTIALGGVCGIQTDDFNREAFRNAVLFGCGRNCTGNAGHLYRFLPSARRPAIYFWTGRQ